MAVQIIQEPAVIAWAKNPMIFEMQTDRVLQDPGQLLKFELDFAEAERGIPMQPPLSGEILNDWWFELSIMGVTTRFVVTDELNDSGVTIAHKEVFVDTREDFVQRVMTTIQSSILFLNEHFTVSRSGEKIFFVAKNNDQLFNVNMTNDDQLVLRTTQLQVEKKYTPNLGLYVELKVNDKKVVNTVLPVGMDGKCIWDVSLLLSSECLALGNDLPNVNQIAFEKGQSIAPYSIHVTELYGERQVTHSSVRSTDKWAVYGGMARSGQTLTENLTIGNKTKFLQPNHTDYKTVTISQASWLSWLNIGTTMTEVKVRVEIQYSDGVIFPFTAHTYASVAKYDKLIIPTGVLQLGLLDKNENKNIVGYSVYLTCAGAEISTVMHYHIDDRYLPYARYFLYKNSFGAFDTFYTHGKKLTSYELDKSTAKIISIANGNSYGQQIDYDITLQNKEKINTGYKSKSEIKALRDFFLSEEKYMLIGELWTKVNLATTSIEEFEDGNGLFALQFEVSAQGMEDLFFDD